MGPDRKAKIAAWKERNRDRVRAHGRKWARRHIQNVPAEPAPGSPCEICQGPMARVYCDHDHATGEFRGWLCNRCNTRLGGLDDSEWITNAQRYLKRV